MLGSASLSIRRFVTAKRTLWLLWICLANFIIIHSSDKLKKVENPEPESNLHPTGLVKFYSGTKTSHYTLCYRRRGLPWESGERLAPRAPCRLGQPWLRANKAEAASCSTRVAAPAAGPGLVPQPPAGAGLRPKDDPPRPSEALTVDGAPPGRTAAAPPGRRRRQAARSAPLARSRRAAPRARHPLRGARCGPRDSLPRGSESEPSGPMTASAMPWLPPPPGLV